MSRMSATDSGTKFHQPNTKRPPEPRRHLSAWLTVAFLLFCLTRSRGADDPEWPTLEFQPVITNTIPGPTDLTHAKDGTGRLFVVEQTGKVHIIQGGQLVEPAFLSITDRVLSGIEQGLLGITFPPGIGSKGHFYLSYTRKPDGFSVVSRFRITADANVADAESEEVVLVIPQPRANHNGGQLAFGPDGYLYIGVGDGGYSTSDVSGGAYPNARAQDKTILLGKILRIDVESGTKPYAVPTDNPFLTNSTHAPEIWAYGLRNPWKFSFDRQTGDLFIGDVGQGQFEEINFQAAGVPGGRNYGWAAIEGIRTNQQTWNVDRSSLVPPVATYSHASYGIPINFAASVTGGFMYRGPSVPRMDNTYFFADFMTGQFWGLRRSGTNWITQFLGAKNSLNAPRVNASTFGEDEAGNLYVADYNRGLVLKVTDSGRVARPELIFSSGALSSRILAVECMTPGARIHYTTNGLDPSVLDPFVSAGQTIRVATTNKLLAVREGLLPSEISTAVLNNFQVGTVAFSPIPGAVTNGTFITLSTDTPEARIYYTTNGAVPTTNSAVYSSPLKYNWNLQSMRINAIARAPGYRDSAFAGGTFFRARTGNVAFTPPEGPISKGTPVALSCGTAESKIFYTLDGSDPTTNSAVYSTPLIINPGDSIRAFAVAPLHIDSLTATANYWLVSASAPKFTPASGNVAYGSLVSLSASTPGAIIHFTLDGTDPTSASARYLEPIPIYGPTVIRALAIADEHLDSPISSAEFNLIPADPPVFHPDEGPLTNGSSVTITVSVPNGIVRYTLDGTEPTESSQIYSSPIEFAGPFTLRARTYADRYSVGEAVTRYYGLRESLPTVVTDYAGGPVPALVDGPLSTARFNTPVAIRGDPQGNLYVADSGNNVIRKISPSGMVSTFAGTGEAGDRLGPVAQAQFSQPVGICFDPEGNLYVADRDNCHRICRIGTDGIVSLVANVRPCAAPSSLWRLERDRFGNFFVGTFRTVAKVDLSGEVVTDFGFFDNTYMVGVAIDAETNIFASGGSGIWRFDSDGLGKTNFAGTDEFYSDGPRLSAGFVEITDLAFDAQNNMTVSERFRVRRVSSDGRVRTLAGSTKQGYLNGSGSVARFTDASGIFSDAAGNVYVADAGNHRIRKIWIDTDGDAIPDELETVGTPYVAGTNDREADSDHDGMNNSAEYWAGTGPSDPESFLAIESVVVEESGEVRIRWRSVKGVFYVVKSSDDLQSWTTVGVPIVGTGDMVSMTDPKPASIPGSRCYRVFLADVE